MCYSDYSIYDRQQTRLHSVPLLYLQRFNTNTSEDVTQSVAVLHIRDFTGSNLSW